MSDWSALPYDIIHKVTTYLVAIEDFLSLSAVCRSWRSVYLTKEWQPGPQIPLLMFLDAKNSGSTSFFSLYRKKVCKSVFPEASGRRFWGTSTEWLLTLGSDFQMHLLNFSTCVCKSLPSANSLGMHFGEVVGWSNIIFKSLVVKTIPQNGENLLVMVIYGPFNHLSLCRPGYKSWIGVKDKFRERFLDIACVRNQIVAMCDSGALVAVEINGQDPPKLVYVSLPNRLWAWRQIYLVESFGDLWLVCEYRDKKKQSTVKSKKFLVYSYDFSERQWFNLSDLGNRAIFLGDSCCLCVEVSDCLSCRSNQIHFMVNKLDLSGSSREGHVCYVLGVFDMTTGASEPLCISPDIPYHYCCPLWLIPTLS